MYHYGRLGYSFGVSTGLGWLGSRGRAEASGPCQSSGDRLAIECIVWAASGSIATAPRSMCVCVCVCMCMCVYVCVCVCVCVCTP